MEELKQKFDTQNLYQVISELPSQVLRAWEFTEEKFVNLPDKIYISGMGGSALPANIFKTFLNNSQKDFKIPIHINRGYEMPAQFGHNSGGIFISYSGNTEETLSCFEQALKIGNINLIAIATGGKLKEMAKQNNIPFIEIPNDVRQPRMGYGYFTGALLKILVNSGLLNINFDEIKTDVEKLLEFSSQAEQQSIELAKSLTKKIPIIYTSDQWKYLAMIVKINFNENSKVQSFWNAFPELNHNEMVGYTNLLSDYKIIIFKDPDDHERVQKRMDIFKKILGEKMDVEIIDMQDGSVFYKIFSTLMIGLWASYFLALVNEIDPAPVEMVEKFKNLMKE